MRCRVRVSARAAAPPGPRSTPSRPRAAVPRALPTMCRTPVGRGAPQPRDHPAVVGRPLPPRDAPGCPPGGSWWWRSSVPPFGARPASGGSTSPRPSSRSRHPPLGQGAGGRAPPSPEPGGDLLVLAGRRRGRAPGPEEVVREPAAPVRARGWPPLPPGSAPLVGCRLSGPPNPWCRREASRRLVVPAARRGARKATTGAGPGCHHRRGRRRGADRPSAVPSSRVPVPPAARGRAGPRPPPGAPHPRGAEGVRGPGSSHRLGRPPTAVVRRRDVVRLVTGHERHPWAGVRGLPRGGYGVRPWDA
ncbi:hypothetical protein G443_003986 [Actinoalloteichus cyanogriseus DSM 43889]|uniref:Basic proline-rich protein n=1 Tax=Actinoalloteichus caeruleus DSM 43889 TaxID=1120930 RepID=A0ABT1JPV3_ACTCY|nr:hypothetical protein [Actinoalloteichus caeruleus DSM 43889]